METPGDYRESSSTRCSTTTTGEHDARSSNCIGRPAIRGGWRRWRERCDRSPGPRWSCGASTTPTSRSATPSANARCSQVQRSSSSSRAATGRSRTTPVRSRRRCCHSLEGSCAAESPDAFLTVTESTAPGTYCTATRDGRWRMSRTVTGRTRREWLRMMAAMGAGALVDGLLPRELARAANHPQDPVAAARARIGAIPIQAQPLGENLTLLAGPGGNVVVLRGSDGLVVVDTFVAPAWPKFQESLKGFAVPVKFVINTHWHFDHTDNNAPLRAGGATLVAHENTKLRMTEPHHLAVLELDFPPSPAAALPQRVFKDGYKLEANGDRLAVTHVPPAHTDTDVVVRFEKANVLHAGDVFFNGRYPYIDGSRSEEHTFELQSRGHLVCRLLLEKKKIKYQPWCAHSIASPPVAAVSL